MPGISIVSGNDLHYDNAVERAFDAVRFFDDYDVTKEITGDRNLIGYSRYPEYPVQCIETDHATVLLEGYLYDVDDVKPHLRRISSYLVNGRSVDIRDWLLKRDGDFLIVVYRQDEGDIYVLNDLFSRLPTYCTIVENTVVVSRELKFVREFTKSIERPLAIDQLAVGQQLLFGYPLGNRTPFSGVETIPPASVVHVDEGIEIDQLYRHEFQGKAHADKSADENAAALAERFATACENRDLGGSTNIISLSGGLDSRAVASVYADIDISETAVTFGFEDGRNSADVQTAKQVADTLDLDWDVMRLTPTDRRRSEILDMKQGMNYLGMAFILDFLERLRHKYEPTTYVTGDGGDKIFVDVTPPSTYRSEAELATYVIDANSVIPVETAARIAGVDVDDLQESVEERLRAYPEVDLKQKYVHFLIRERGFNCLNHGEDRNRYYFWSVTPFYSLPVFQYAMNCPNAQKRNYELYIEFLERFSPELLNIEYPDFGAPITSLEFKAKSSVYEFLSRHPGLLNTVVSFVQSDEVSENGISKTIESQASQSNLAPLSEEDIQTAVRTLDTSDLKGLNYLLTLTSLVEDLQTEQLIEAAQPL